VYLDEVIVFTATHTRDNNMPTYEYYKEAYQLLNFLNVLLFILEHLPNCVFPGYLQITIHLYAFTELW
jgi:hypothetical protein